MTRPSPKFGMYDVVTAGNTRMRPRTGVIIAVFVDGAHAAAYFRCGRCDRMGADHDGAGEFLGVYDGYVYLVRGERDAVFAAREVDASLTPYDDGAVRRGSVGRVSAAPPPPVATPTVAREPSKRQVPYLVAMSELQGRTGHPVSVKDIMDALNVRSFASVHDTLNRLVAHGLVGEVEAPAGGGYRRTLFQLTEDGHRWLAGSATAET